jgi:uncharacterized membrane protein YbhN (UPF0104 family)
MAIRQVKRLEPMWLLPGLAALTVQFLLRSVRWSRLLTATAYRHVPVRRVIEPLLVGYLGNNLLPARAGEAVRAVLVARREDLGLGEVAATVITERVLDLVTLLAVGAVAVWLATGGVGGIGIGLLVAGLGGLIGVRIAARQADKRGWFDRLPSSRLVGLVRGLLTTLGRLPVTILLLSGGFSLLAWACDAVLMLSVGRAVGVELPVLGAIAIGAGAVVGTAAPSAPGFVGTYELAALAGGASVGLAPEVVLPVAIVAHLMGLVPVSLAGAVAMARLGGRSSVQFRPNGRASGAA